MLIAESPWLIAPTWTPLTSNQRLSTFKRSFEAWFKEQHNGQTVSLAIDKRFAVKRPDFILVGYERKLRVVELKAPGHTMNDDDMKRLENYFAAFRKFFATHAFVREEFPNKFQVDLIVDDIRFEEPRNQNAFENYEQLGELRRMKWRDFLAQAEKANEEFMDLNSRLNRVNS